MARCMFASGSSTDKGQQAPDRCKRAVWEKYKVVIEQCEIQSARECPLRAFLASSIATTSHDDGRVSGHCPSGCLK